MHWIPNTDVTVDDEGLNAIVELAGIGRDDLELLFEGNRLHISGKRGEPVRRSGNKFFVKEINYGTFECVLEVPPGYNLDQAKAVFQSGFLRVFVPLRAPPESSGRQ